MNLKFLKEGAAVKDVEIPGTQSAVQALTIAHDSGAAVAGQEVVLSTSALLYVDKLRGLFDSLGKLQIVVGPSFGAKGDVQITARHKNKTATLNIRFV